MLTPPPRLSQLPHTPRRPLGSRAPATAVPSHSHGPRRSGEARAQPWPRSSHQRRDEARVGPVEWWRQPPGRKAARGAGPAPPLVRPSPARLVSPRALLTGAAGEQEQQHPQSARDATEEPHGRGEAGGPGRARSARCRARGGPGRGRGAGAGPGWARRGGLRSLPSPGLFRRAGRGSAAVPVRGAQRAGRCVCFTRCYTGDSRVSLRRSVSTCGSRAELLERRLRTALTAGDVRLSVVQTPFIIFQQSLNCVDLSSLLMIAT